MTPPEKTISANPPSAAILASAGSSFPPSDSRRRIVLAALLIFAAALVVRVSFIGIQAMDSPQAWSRSAPFGQAEMGNISMNLAAGRGFSSPFGPGSTPTAWLCPLIPFLWALIIRVMGGANGHTALMVAYSGAVPSAACVVAYWLILRHVLRGSPAWRRIAVFAAVVFCIWPDALYQLDFLWYFPWEELATALVVLLGMRWIDRPSLKTVVPLGIAAGILGLINVTPLPVFAVILLLPVFRDGAARKRVLACGAVGASLALLFCLPWLIRDAVVLHATVAMRSNGGFQFYEGNNPSGCVREAGNSRHPAIQTAELQRYKAMGEIAYSREGFHLALAYIRAHPRVTAVRMAERAYVFWLTDVTDHWKWNASSPSWWQQGRPAIVKTLSATLAAWGLLAVLIWAWLTKRLANLPYKGVFVSLLLLLPFPYYFTLAENEYSEILRSWLLVLAMLALSGMFRPSAVSRDLPE